VTNRNYIPEYLEEQVKFGGCLLPFCSESSVSYSN